MFLVGLCKDCIARPGEVAYTLMHKYKKVEGRRNELHRICASCSGTPPGEEVKCESIDCSVLYARARAKEEGKQMSKLLIEWEKL